MIINPNQYNNYNYNNINEPESKPDYVVIDIPEGNEPSPPHRFNLLNASSGLMSRVQSAASSFFKKADIGLRIIDVGLDVASEANTIIGQRDLSQASKSLRGEVKFLQNIQSVGQGKLELDPNSIIQSPEKRARFVKSMFGLLTILKTTLDNLKPENLGEHEVLYNQITKIAGQSLYIVKVTSKITKFEVASRNWLNLSPLASEETVKEARLALCSASLNLTCEVAKLSMWMYGAGPISTSAEKLLSTAYLFAGLIDGELLHMDLTRKMVEELTSIVVVP